MADTVCEERVLEDPRRPGGPPPTVAIFPWQPAAASLAALLIAAMLRAANPAGQILYTEDVEVQRREGIVGERGELLVAGLPFEPGQAVEVFVVLKAAPSLTTQN